MPTRGKAFFSGVKAATPILLGVIPFALIAGISAVNAGFTRAEAIGMSSIVFAGAAQLAAVDLVSQHSSTIAILLTALVINLRFCMYSASLSPHFSGLPFSVRAVLAYLLTDQAYAVSVIAFNNERKKFKHFFYLGTALTLWVIWQTGTIIGVQLGALIPSSWSLDFAVPLTFLALLFPAIVTRPALIAAVVSGVLALAAHSLPYNLGLFVAALGGIVAGYLADRGRGAC
jgi:4-azaleucine resistance transporter AzlC